MKKVTLIKTALTLAACVILLAGVAPAQTVRATVPFAFEANGTVMPAGEYQVGMDWARGMLTVGRLGGSSVFVSAQTTLSGVDTDSGAIVFHRYGNRFYLKSVKAPAAGQGMAAIPSKAEKEAARGGKPLEVAMIRVLTTH